MRKAALIGFLSIAACLSTTLPARAGIPECGNLRFEGLSNCEVRLTAQCTAGCSELGIYKTACANKLVTTCAPQCTLSATATCSDKCTVQCKSDCDNGVNVICAHNCFAECTVIRDDSCKGKADAEQCAATWNANCDHECGAKCVTVEGGCYQHCIECCDGSCTADANMDCQEVCQTNQIEECQHEFRANCDASCDGDGALFCDGQFIIAGSQIQACVNALAAQGLTVKVEGKVTIGADGVKGGVNGISCALGPENRGPLAAPFALLAAAAGWFARRRKRS